MDTEKAQEYLKSILNKNLRVYTSDGRLFWGALKCTDPPSSHSLRYANHKHFLCSERFLCASARLAVQATITIKDGTSGVLFILLLVAIEVTVSSRPRAAIVQRHILAGEIVPLTSANVVTTSLRQCAGAGRELGRHNGVRRDPVGERIFAVLDDGLASLISVIGLASLTRSDRSIIDKLE
ncbi:hypothetical protein HG530_004463 [Fusarium avenaceum]|nr:hypothetical protein HG530_004463 [Fusarium avenaceum]